MVTNEQQVADFEVNEIGDEIDFIGFTIEGEPVPKGRPRFSSKNGRAFTPQRTKNYEEHIYWSFIESLKEDGIYGDFKPFDEPVHITIRIFKQIPKSRFNKIKKDADARLALSNSNLPNPSRPDLDNIVKSVTDALNGVAFTDDALITSIYATKTFTEENSHVSVSIHKEIY